MDETDLVPLNPVQIKGAGKIPRSANRDKPVISVEEAGVMIENSPANVRAGVALLLWCGLRLGELLELRRKDLVGLDGDGAVTVRVRRTAQRVQDPVTRKSRMVPFDTPKSAAGNRDVTVPAKVAQRLREHAETFMGDGADALVITTRTGSQMLDTTFRERFKLGKLAAGRKDVTPHDCRRFFGTQLVTNGVDLESARLLMGHENVTQLMEYQRAASGYGESAAAVLDRLAD
ncbi:site-specific integrase [Corynebacterium sp. CNJ-954]|uniref:site-specific integrase n=1 Tax=Corynebacterium sp. CNJ-954 TaxID=1904962 RepID=UPI001300F9D6|nr:site-specific integrase [Corynebacterium sp. CNJ-954]